jgi:hypothetical protein
MVDLLSAYALMQIANSGQAAVTRLFTSSRKELRWSSTAIAAGCVHRSYLHKLRTDRDKLSLQSLHSCDMHCALDIRSDEPLRSDCYGKSVSRRHHHICALFGYGILPRYAPCASVPTTSDSML